MTSSIIGMFVQMCFPGPTNIAPHCEYPTGNWAIYIMGPDCKPWFTMDDKGRVINHHTKEALLREDIVLGNQVMSLRAATELERK